MKEHNIRHGGLLRVGARSQRPGAPSSFTSVTAMPNAGVTCTIRSSGWNLKVGLAEASLPSFQKIPVRHGSDWRRAPAEVRDGERDADLPPYVYGFATLGQAPRYWHSSARDKGRRAPVPVFTIISNPISPAIPAARWLLSGRGARRWGGRLPRSFLVQSG